MTRDEFYDEITSWSELLSFCYEHDLYSCEYIRTADDIVDDLIDILRHERTNDAMSRVYDILDNIDDFTCDYFDDSDDCHGLDENDFGEYLDRVADEYDEDIGFEYDDEDDDDAGDFYSPDPVFVDESDPWNYDSSIVDESVDILVFDKLISCQ